MPATTKARAVSAAAVPAPVPQITQFSGPSPQQNLAAKSTKPKLNKDRRRTHNLNKDAPTNLK
jgi:hypothetical protein